VYPTPDTGAYRWHLSCRDFQRNSNIDYNVGKEAPAFNVGLEKCRSFRNFVVTQFQVVRDDLHVARISVNASVPVVIAFQVVMSEVGRIFSRYYRKLRLSIFQIVTFSQFVRVVGIVAVCRRRPLF
jgi:hypothetical protein